MTIKELCNKCNQCAKCPFQAACDILNCTTPNNLDENQFHDVLVTKSIIETAKMLESKETWYWIEHTQNGLKYIECQNCKTWFIRDHLIRNSFCPNCGKKMRWCNG